MTIINDLTTLRQFFQEATQAVSGIDLFRGVSNGEEGVQEIQHLFETEIKAGQVVCLYQVAETPITDNGAGYSKAVFACTLMVLKKMPSAKINFDMKLQARDEIWKKTLKLIGKIKLAADWFTSNYTELQDEAYDVQFSIFQDRILPIGKIANANVQGWLVDIDISIPVNKLLYGQ